MSGTSLPEAKGEGYRKKIFLLLLNVVRKENLCKFYVEYSVFSLNLGNILFLFIYSSIYLIKVLYFRYLFK